MRVSSLTVSFLYPQITGSHDMEAVTFKKLVKGHAYSLTGVDEVSQCLIDAKRVIPVCFSGVLNRENNNYIRLDRKDSVETSTNVFPFSSV